MFWNFDSKHGESVLPEASYAAYFASLLLSLLSGAWIFSRYSVGLTFNAKNLLPVLLVAYVAIPIVHWASLTLSKRVLKRLSRGLSHLVDSAISIEKDLDLSGYEAADILIARSVGDEASSFIGMSHLFSWLVTRVWFGSERFASRLAGGVVEAAFPKFVLKNFPRTLTGLVRLYLQISGLYLFLLSGCFLGYELLKFPRIRLAAAILITPIGVGYVSCQAIFGGLIVLSLLLFFGSHLLAYGSDYALSCPIRLGSCKKEYSSLHKC